MKKLLMVALCMALAVGTSFAKENISSKTNLGPVNERTGIGYTQLSNFKLSSLSLRHWFKGSLGIEGILGFSFADNNNVFDIGGKFLSVVKKESNMVLYGFGLIGIENYAVTNNNNQKVSETDFQLGGGFGVEFFLNGLPNLGLGAEVGFAYTSALKQFGIFSGWIPTVGMRYYF